MSESWGPVDAALDRAAAAGRGVPLWLRDDDAVDASAALDRLTVLCESHRLPVLLAVIPQPARPALARFVAAHPILLPTQHGFAHANHAGPGERACELGGARPQAAVLGDLVAGRDRLDDLFGDAMARILVPPWNRIRPDLLLALPEIGFEAISTFDTATASSEALPALNCTLDIIDWRNGRVCRSPDRLVADLVRGIEAGVPIGLLTHHLVHDEAAWLFLEQGLERLGRHPALQFTSAPALLSASRDGGERRAAPSPSDWSVAPVRR